MTPRLVVAAGFVIAASAATAHAQAPGQVVVLMPQTAPMVQPTILVEAPPPQVNPMAHRFSIALSLGTFGVGDAESGDGTQFSIAEFAMRYRASRRVEIEMTSFGGRETLGDGLEGDLATGSLAFGARYRFMPERKFNWFLSAGIGGAIIAPSYSSEDERANSTHPIGTLGIGAEWRFRPHWALQAEFKMMSIGPAGGEEYDAAPVVQGDVPSTARVNDSDDLSGGTFNVGLAWFL